MKGAHPPRNGLNALTEHMLMLVLSTQIPHMATKTVSVKCHLRCQALPVRLVAEATTPRASVQVNVPVGVISARIKRLGARQALRTQLQHRKDIVSAKGNPVMDLIQTFEDCKWGLARVDPWFSDCDGGVYFFRQASFQNTRSFIGISKFHAM